MNLHVCKSCGAVTNAEVRGRCLRSRNGKHTWLSGNLANDFVKRLWRLKAYAVRSGTDISLTAPRS